MKEKLRVVMIDDNKALVRFISSLLVDRGFEVFCMSTREEAERFLGVAEEEIRVVLLDYVIGNEKGDPLALMIRKKYPACRIILISGCAPKEFPYIEGLLANGVIDAFVEKPFTIADIERHLEFE